MKASEIVEQLRPMDLSERDAEVLRRLMPSMPDIPNDTGFARVQARLCDAHGKQINDGPVIELQVLRDYLSLGDDKDFLRIPMYPETAQRLADAWNCSLITPRLSLRIWEQATRLTPEPLPEKQKKRADGTTVKTFIWRDEQGRWNTTEGSARSLEAYVIHNAMIEKQLKQRAIGRDVLLAGHKKDIVINASLAHKPVKLVLYGWHQSNGVPIQDVSTRHAMRYVDYSHGVRLVRNEVLVDGKSYQYAEVLKHPKYHSALSSVPLKVCRYPTSSA